MVCGLLVLIRGCKFGLFHRNSLYYHSKFPIRYTKNEINILLDLISFRVSSCFLSELGGWSKMFTIVHQYNDI